MKRLFVYFAGLGDLVIFIPLFRKLSENGQLDLLTRSYGKPLFDEQAYIGNTFTLMHPNRGKKGIARVLFSRHRRAMGSILISEGYDEIIVLAQERTVITDWIKTWCGSVPVKVMTYPEGDPERLKKGFESLGIDSGDRDPYPLMEVSPESRQVAKRKLSDLGEKVVGIQIGSGPSNVWLRKRPNLKGLPLQQWADLICGMLDGGSIDALVFHGTNKETRDVDAVRRLVPAKYKRYLYDWTGELGVKGLGGVLAESYAFVSVDTGPAHIAAAVGCPMLVVFGPSDPIVYPMRGEAPVELLLGKADCQFCMGTPAFKACRNNICMQSLGIEKLMDGWKNLEKRISNNEN